MRRLLGSLWGFAGRVRGRLSASSIVAAAGVTVALVSLLYGPGLLRRADLTVSGQVIDVGPSDSMALQFWNMLVSMSSVEEKGRFYDGVRQGLLDNGFTREQVNAMLAPREACLRDPKLPIIRGDRKLTAYEEQRIAFVASTSARQAMAAAMQDFRRRYAPAPWIAYFEVENHGGSEATDVEVTVRSKIPISDAVVEGDSLDIEKKVEGSTASFRVRRISPTGRLRGVLWLGSLGGGDEVPKVDVVCSWQHSLRRLTLSSLEQPRRERQ